MQIGAISFRPYIFNTNIQSSRSLSKISPIGEDLLASKTDFSSLTEDDGNTNPLRKGQSANFADIFAMQMQTARLSASRLFKPGKEPEGEAAAEQVQAGHGIWPDRNSFHMQQAIETYQVNMLA